MTNLGWQELYKAALLELRPDQLRSRIDTAEAAIHLRLQELAKNADSTNEEQHAIADALRGLRTLSNSECKPAVIYAQDAPARAGVAS
jgi:hypothetical protein